MNALILSVLTSDWCSTTNWDLNVPLSSSSRSLIISTENLGFNLNSNYIISYSSEQVFSFQKETIQNSEKLADAVKWNYFNWTVLPLLQNCSLIRDYFD